MAFLRSLTVCVVLLHVLFITTCLEASRQSSKSSSEQSSSYEDAECNLDNLKPLEPIERIKHEAGHTDIWDENDPQLRCVGGSVVRHFINQKGLLVPNFNSAPGFIFVLGGRGVLGLAYPGCAETFQSFQQSGQGEQGSSSFRDQHQKIQELRPGDVVAINTGVAHWAYNEANQELVLLVVHHINNRQNQLDQYLRRFFFAGSNPQQEQQQGQQQQGQRQFGFNFFKALDAEVMGRALGVRQEVIERIKNPRGSRGFIVTVREGLRFARPSQEERRQGQEQQQQDENGLEETFCSAKIKENLFNPERADIYTAEGGSITTVNSFDLPILQTLQLSAGRGRLQPNAIVVPHWNMNAHSLSFVTQGSGRVQIVGQSNEPLFDGEVRQDQLLIIPQNFIHFKQAGQQGLEWVTLKTNQNAKTSPVLGKTSVFRGVPLDIWMNVFQIQRDDAWALKYNREEVSILHPHFRPQFEGQQQQRGRSEWSIL